MVTVEIKWDGREETIDGRLGVVKEVKKDLEDVNKELEAMG